MPWVSTEIKILDSLNQENGKSVKLHYPASESL
ncbi:hypothetical protein SAMN05421760_102422 [Neptunomonas antarctica]|uniref:Uncharacterized protein n=1 Tax=Neptunomonas antarctica TaxID=619304 RepID=A0A1N7KGF3_9GAMM|nr:hypothetical protein SAMN05421760_102422 [Neptunomonas antarctica]